MHTGMGLISEYFDEVSCSLQTTALEGDQLISEIGRTSVLRLPCDRVPAGDHLDLFAKIFAV